MKRRVWIGLLLTFGALLFRGMVELAQAQLFDLEESRQEIETMRGILRTTLGFALKSPQKSEDTDFPMLAGSGGSPRIGGYYLYGQGALFTVSLGSLASLFPEPPEPPDPPEPAAAPEPPAPPLPPLLGDDDVAAVRQQAETARVEAAKAAAQAKQFEKDSARIQQVARKQAEKARQQMKKWREQMQADRAKLGEQMTAAKSALIDALAKHGDSLTVVKPQEYLTIVISGDSQG